MNNLKICREKVEEVMRLFAQRLRGALSDTAVPEEACSEGKKLPLMAAAGGGPYYFLRTLAQRGRATVSEIAAELGVTLAAVTVLTNKLVASGWVSRWRDERDRRVVWLGLTPAGEGILYRIQAVRDQVFTRYFGCLSSAEIDALTDIMKKVLAGLQEEASDRGGEG
ncbi:MAG: MarR family transcriptional regulator [Bacillota bacterium]